MCDESFFLEEKGSAGTRLNEQEEKVDLDRKCHRGASRYPDFCGVYR
jgi:hypothetical protein